MSSVVADLRDYTKADGWQAWIEGTGDVNFTALVVPKEDGTLDLFARAIGSSGNTLGYTTYRTWRPTVGSPVTIIWESEAGPVVAGAGKYNTQMLGGLSLSETAMYSDDTIEILYEGDSGQNRLAFHTSKAGQHETTDLTGSWVAEGRREYRIVWSTTDVQLYVDDVLMATHAVRVPDEEMHFVVSVQAVNDQIAPDTTDVTLTLHTFTPA